MEIIAAVALGLATYVYLDGGKEVVSSQPSENVQVVVQEEQPNVQWVFINTSGLRG